MRLRSLILASIVCALGCGKSDSFGPASPVQKSSWRPSHTFSVETPEEEFRKSPPLPGVRAVRPPQDIRDTRLPNGLRVLTLEQHQLPFVSIRVVIDRGSDQAPLGVAAFAAEMLFAGTSARRDGVLRQAFDEMGAAYGADALGDGLTLDVKVPAPSLRPALLRISDILRDSTFPTKELEIVRRRQLRVFDAWKASPSSRASITLDSILFPPEHPYHYPHAGTPEAVQALTQSDLRRFQAAVFAPARATLIVVGDFEPAKLSSTVATIFGAWSGTAAPPSAPPPTPPPKPRSVVIVDRPGDTQSNIRLGWIGVARDDADVSALRVLSTVLGGSGSLVSRLNRSVRGSHGFSAGVEARFSFGRSPQTFAISAAVERDHTAESITQILSELDRIRTEPVDTRELARGKSDAGARSFETQSDAVIALTPPAIFGVPLDSFIAGIGAPLKVTPEDVQRVANAHLPAESMQIVIVGDAARIRADLEALKLGELTVRN